MNGIWNVMAHDHKACDDEFARIEQASAAGDWAATASALEAFVRSGSGCARVGAS